MEKKAFAPNRHSANILIRSVGR